MWEQAQCHQPGDQAEEPDRQQQAFFKGVNPGRFAHGLVPRVAQRGPATWPHKWASASVCLAIAAAMTTTTDPPSTEPAGGTSPRRGSQRVLWAVGLVVILLVALAIKEPELLLPIGPDQGTYSYVAERILDGQLPYVDAWDNKPPATYYLHAAVLALVPELSLIHI